MTAPPAVTIYLAYGAERRRISTASRASPCVGIWWSAETSIVALVQPVVEIRSHGSLLDADLSHDREWPLVAPHFGLAADDDYFVVPRGRVLWDHRGCGRGVIYHGNAITALRLRQIAGVFRLMSYSARLDEHYLTGDAADWLFEDE